MCWQAGLAARCWFDLRETIEALWMLCITPCGRRRHSLRRSAALLFLPVAGLLAAKRRRASYPDPHYHSVTRVMQGIPRRGCEWCVRILSGKMLYPRSGSRII